MAFVVEAERVTAVRIGEEWLAVEEGTFTIDSFAYSAGGGEVGNREMGVRATLAGAGGLFAAPLSAVMGVRYAAAAE